MSDNAPKPHAARPPAARSVDRFLAEAARHPRTKAGGRCRLQFALDATASRQPTWDLACELQARLFDAARDLADLELELSFFRGFREFRTSGWVRDADALRRRMTTVRCRAGRTQIERVLRHAIAESRRERVRALVYVGDCMEEDPDRLGDLAGELGLLGTPVFAFHEGRDPLAAATFRQLARASGGAFAAFEPGAPERLAALLRGVAVFAAGGREALAALAREDRTVAGLLEDLGS